MSPFFFGWYDDSQTRIKISGFTKFICIPFLSIDIQMIDLTRHQQLGKLKELEIFQCNYLSYIWEWLINYFVCNNFGWHSALKTRDRKLSPMIKNRVWPIYKKVKVCHRDGDLIQITGLQVYVWLYGHPNYSFTILTSYLKSLLKSPIKIN